MRTKHQGNHAVNCPVCITAASKDAMFGRSYLEQMALQPERYEKPHKAALRRAERADAMRSLGLTRVRGSQGGTYWE